MNGPARAPIGGPVPARIGGPAPARIGPIPARVTTCRRSAADRTCSVHGGAASGAGAVSGAGAPARPSCAGGAAGGSVASTTASMNSMIAGCCHHGGGPGGAGGEPGGAGRAPPGGAPAAGCLTQPPPEPLPWDCSGDSPGPGPMPMPRWRSIWSMASPSGLRRDGARGWVGPVAPEDGCRRGRPCIHADPRRRQARSLCCSRKKIIRAMIWAIQAGVTSGESGPYRPCSGS